MRVLVISDTHGYHEPLIDIMAEDGPFDTLIHCGDLEGEEQAIMNLTGPECACVMVAGNNDFFSGLPKEKIIDIEGHRILITHGHTYYVSMGTTILKDEAAARDVEIVMFGHTHKPVVDMTGPVIAVNPGSLTYPRQYERRRSYIIMTVEKNTPPSFEICYL